MQSLIDDILTLSRLSKNDTEHELVNVNKIVAQIVDDLEISIKDKGAQIYAEVLPAVKGVPGQLHQLFQNLISNAIKFNQGAPIINITSQPVAPELASELKIASDNFYCIRVEDNGIGFEDKFNEKIFGIFQRLEKTTYQGTGIGLAIVKKIVDNHKGFVKAEGKPGEGSCFTIVLPK